jgi:hypothetical protein
MRFSLDLTQLVKYVLEGLAVAVAAFFIPRKNMNTLDILLIGVTAAATFAVLDMFSPFVGTSARQGAGFGIGYNMVTGGGYEGFEGQEGGETEEGVEAEGFDGEEVEGFEGQQGGEVGVQGVDSAENLATF